MRVWTVHTPPEAPGLRRTRRIEGRLPALVPEGFAWLAFLAGLPWLLWHRIWLEAVIYLAGVAILAALLPVKVLVVAALAVQWLLGAQAQDLRRAALARRGFHQAHVVAEGDADRAMARVLAMRPELIPATTQAHPA